MTLTPDDLADTTVNTDYGTITVARALLALWNRYGWPSDDTLQTIAEEQGVYPPPQTGSPHRKTLDQMTSNDLDELHARLDDYENRITWDTTCGSCARILDSSILETERATRAEAALARIRELAADVDDRNWRAPGTEVAARIRLALGDPPDNGPSVADCAADDRRWPLEKAGE